MNLVVRDARLGGMLLDQFEAGIAECPALGLDEVKRFLANNGALKVFDRVFRDFQ
jgi:hypothetical protein